MGEAKRKREGRTPVEQAADEASKIFADQGRLIEAGWASYRVFVVAPDAGEEQLRQLRMAFMSGAQHLWGAFHSFLDPGDEATERDLKRMDLIDAELRKVASEFIAASDGMGNAKGNA
jgi:hypothetical protein